MCSADHGGSCFKNGDDDLDLANTKLTRASNKSGTDAGNMGSEEEPNSLFYFRSAVLESIPPSGSTRGSLTSSMTKCA